MSCTLFSHWLFVSRKKRLYSGAPVIETAPSPLGSPACPAPPVAGVPSGPLLGAAPGFLSPASPDTVHAPITASSGASARVRYLVDPSGWFLITGAPGDSPFRGTAFEQQSQPRVISVTANAIETRAHAFRDLAEFSNEEADRSDVRTRVKAPSSRARSTLGSEDGCQGRPNHPEEFSRDSYRIKTNLEQTMGLGVREPASHLAGRPCSCPLASAREAGVRDSSRRGDHQKDVDHSSTPRGPT